MTVRMMGEAAMVVAVLSTVGALAVWLACVRTGREKPTPDVAMVLKMALLLGLACMMAADAMLIYDVSLLDFDAGRRAAEAAAMLGCCAFLYMDVRALASGENGMTENTRKEGAE